MQIVIATFQVTAYNILFDNNNKNELYCEFLLEDAYITRKVRSPKRLVELIPIYNTDSNIGFLMGYNIFRRPEAVQDERFCIYCGNGNQKDVILARFRL